MPSELLIIKETAKPMTDRTTPFVGLRLPANREPADRGGFNIVTLRVSPRYWLHAIWRRAAANLKRSTPVISVKASPKASAAPALTLLKGMLVGFPEAAFGRPQAGLRATANLRKGCRKRDSAGWLP
jgi:hypothetical protein